MLVLRTCDKDLRAYGGFQWPAAGPVEAPDWEPTPQCGHGLHGYPWGEGDGECLSSAEDAKWLVVEVEEATLVRLDGDGKAKFPGAKWSTAATRTGRSSTSSSTAAWAAR
jgi:hypothetical protein